MARVKTKGLEQGELIRLVSHNTNGTLSLYRGRRFSLGADQGFYGGNEALRALARAILREVPARRKRGK
jgi:hypothetical protein